MESPNTPPTVNGNHPPINQGQDSQAAVNGDVGSGVSESSVSDVSVQPDNRVTVIYHFEATNANEMTIAPGDILVVVEKAETGWWLVRGDRGVGWVPGTYLREQVIEQSQETESSEQHP